MSDEIEGVYVQAWVWVDLTTEDGYPTERAALTDESVREIARDQWQDWGEVEIDDDAVISWPADLSLAVEVGPLADISLDDRIEWLIGVYRQDVVPRSDAYGED